MSYNSGQAEGQFGQATGGPEGSSQSSEGYDRRQQSSDRGYQQHPGYMPNSSHPATQERYYATDSNSQAPLYPDTRRQVVIGAPPTGHEFSQNWTQGYDDPRSTQNPGQWTGNLNPQHDVSSQFGAGGSQHDWQSNRPSDRNVDDGQQPGHQGWSHGNETHANDLRPVMNSLAPDPQAGSNSTAGAFSDPPYVDLRTYAGMGTDILSAPAPVDDRAVQERIIQLRDAEQRVQQQQAQIEMERQHLQAERLRQDELRRQLELAAPPLPYDRTAIPQLQGTSVSVKHTRSPQASVIDDESRRKRRRVELTVDQAFEAFVRATAQGTSIDPDKVAYGCGIYYALMQHFLRTASDLTSSQVDLEASHTWRDMFSDMVSTPGDQHSRQASARAQSKARTPDAVDQLNDAMPHVHKQEALAALRWGNNISNLSFSTDQVPHCKWVMETPLRGFLEERVLALGTRAANQDDEEVSKNEYDQWAAYVTHSQGQASSHRKQPTDDQPTDDQPTGDQMQLEGLSILNLYWVVNGFRHAPPAFLHKGRFSNQPWELFNKGVVNVGYSMLQFCATQMYDRENAPPWSPIPDPFADFDASIKAIDVLYQGNLRLFNKYNNFYSLPARMLQAWAELAHSSTVGSL